MDLKLKEKATKKLTEETRKHVETNFSK